MGTRSIHRPNRLLAVAALPPRGAPIRAMDSIASSKQYARITWQVFSRRLKRGEHEQPRTLRPRWDLSPDVAGSWYGTVARAVLEAHFTRGFTFAVADRRSNLARLYDLPERVISQDHFTPLSLGRTLSILDRAGRAHGIATAADLADYYRMSSKDCRTRLDELVEAGRLRRVKVENWRDLASVHIEAKRRGVQPRGATFLSPVNH